MGLLSKREQETEALLLNPNIGKMARAFHKGIRQKVLSSLVNEEDVAEHYKQMFEPETEYMNPERSKHPDIPPASVRIRNFKRKEFP